MYFTSRFSLMSLELFGIVVLNATELVTLPELVLYRSYISDGLKKSVTVHHKSSTDNMCSVLPVILPLRETK